MASYIPGQGRKKPQNMMELPVYPDIKRGPPRFRWTGKHWSVDVGRTLMETELQPSFIDNTLRFQSRDYNKFIYGQSSHKDIVNAAFRPPLRVPTQDDVPLSRLPRFLVTPRINPDLAAEFPVFTQQNERPNEINSYLSDRVKSGIIGPTFYMPIDLPQDNSVLPDLESKIPQYSASSGIYMPLQFDVPIYPEDISNKVIIDEGKINPMMFTGFEAPVVGYGSEVPLTFDNDHLNNKLPSGSISSGMNTSFTSTDQLNREGFELEDKMPHASASSGINNVSGWGEPDNRQINLNNKMPSRSISSGISLPDSYGENIEEFDHIQPLIDSKLPSDGNDYRINPETEYREINSRINPKRIQRENPSYSYSVPKSYNSMGLGRDERNEVKYRGKQTAQSKYNGCENGVCRPKKTIETPAVVLRDPMSRIRTQR
jgi:hypothetical protein